MLFQCLSIVGYCQTQIDSLFCQHELEKKCEYGDCMHNVDCDSASFSTFSSLGKEATVFFNCLADLLSQKHYTSYTQVLLLMCRALSFLLLCSAVLAICGSRKVQSTEHLTVSTELHLVESSILID